MSKKWHSIKGFTLVEAIMVVVIIGILATALMYRLSPSQGAAVSTATDQLIADIQYVQMRAMGAGRQHTLFFITGSGVYSTFFVDASGTYVLPGEQKSLSGGVVVTGTTLPVATLPGTTLSANALAFNTHGEPMNFGGTDRTITLAGSRTLTVYAVTGKAE